MDRWNHLQQTGPAGPARTGRERGTHREVPWPDLHLRYVVTEHQPDRLVELKVDRPFPMLVRYELDDAPDGTLVAIHATGTPGGFFRWASPMMKRQVNKSITNDLDRLRTCLES